MRTTLVAAGAFVVGWLANLAMALYATKFGGIKPYETPPDPDDRHDVLPTDDEIGDDVLPLFEGALAYQDEQFRRALDLFKYPTIGTERPLFRATGCACGDTETHGPHES